MSLRWDWQTTTTIREIKGDLGRYGKRYHSLILSISRSMKSEIDTTAGPRCTVECFQCSQHLRQLDSNLALYPDVVPVSQSTGRPRYLPHRLSPRTKGLYAIMKAPKPKQVGSWGGLMVRTLPRSSLAPSFLQYCPLNITLPAHLFPNRCAYGRHLISLSCPVATIN